MLFARSYLRCPFLLLLAPWYLDANVTVRSRVPAGFFSFEFVFFDALAEEYEAVEFSDATTTLSFPEEVPVFFAFGRRAGADTRFVVFLAFSSTNFSWSFISLSSSRW
jgi:hypothetical protein